MTVLFQIEKADNFHNMFSFKLNCVQKTRSCITVFSHSCNLRKHLNIYVSRQAHKKCLNCKINITHMNKSVNALFRLCHLHQTHDTVFIRIQQNWTASAIMKFYFVHINTTLNTSLFFPLIIYSFYMFLVSIVQFLVHKFHKIGCCCFF